MNDIYSTRRDFWGLRLEHSSWGLLLWASASHPEVRWWADALVFSTAAGFVARTPCAIDCLEFA